MTTIFLLIFGPLLTVIGVVMALIFIWVIFKSVMAGTWEAIERFFGGTPKDGL